MFKNIFKRSYLILFLLIGFINSSQVVDIVGIQWFYLANLNGMFLLFVLYDKLFNDGKTHSFFKSSINLLYFLYFLTSCISLTYSINISVSIIALSKIFLILSSLFIFHELDIFKKINLLNVSTLFSILLFVETFYSISGYFEVIKATEFEFSMASGFLKGIASNKNITSASIAFKLPFLFILLFNLKNRLLKILIFLTSILVFYNLILLSSRAILLSISLCVLFYLIIVTIEIVRSKTFFKRHLINIATFVLPILLSVGISKVTLSDNSLNIENRISTINASDESANTRIRYYTKGLKYFIKHPVIASGIGNWQIISIDLDSDNIESYIVPYVAHNDFIEILTEVGLFGFLFYFLFIVSTLYFLFILYTNSKDYKTRNNLIYLSFPFIIYFVDLNQNFPQYRPLMQSGLIVYMLFVYTLHSKKIE